MILLLKKPQKRQVKLAVKITDICPQATDITWFGIIIYMWQRLQFRQPTVEKLGGNGPPTETLLTFTYNNYLTT